MDKNNILLVVGSNLCEAGVPSVIMQLVRKLHDRYIFDVLCFNDEEGYFDNEFLSYGGEIYRTRLVKYEENKILYLFRSKQIKKVLNEILKIKRYTVIHCNCGIESGICVKIAYKLGVRKRVVHAHGTYNRKGHNYFLRLYNYNNKCNILKYATNRIACSSIAGDTLFMGKSFINVLNPVDISLYENILKRKACGNSFASNWILL